MSEAQYICMAWPWKSHESFLQYPIAYTSSMSLFSGEAEGHHRLKHENQWNHLEAAAMDTTQGPKPVLATLCTFLFSTALCGRPHWSICTDRKQR